MPSAKNRMDAKNRRETVAMLEDLLKKIKAGRYRVISKGVWKGVTESKWNYGIHVEDLKVLDESD